MRIYLDNSATTSVDKDVIKAIKPFEENRYGNASSLHKYGQEARKAVETSRELISKAVNAKNCEIVFTSGGTEANNHALKGIAFANKDRNHIITTKIEHESILKTCKWLEKQGFTATYLDVDNQGFISLKNLEKAITKQTSLVSIIHANNEIGTIQDIAEIGKLCKKKRVLFHTDACQSFTKTDVNMEKQNIDLLTINAHKIHGPKGVGALIIRQGTEIDPLLHGGGQEHLMRSGTENVPGIVGFAKAVQIAKEQDNKKMRQLRDHLIKETLKIRNSWLNGPKQKRLCNNVNISFKYVEGESIILHLDSKGIAASTGSACSSKSLQPSYVLSAIGLRPEDSHGSVRLSISKYTTKQDINKTVKALKEIVGLLRKMSPFGHKNLS